MTKEYSLKHQKIIDALFTQKSVKRTKGTSFSLNYLPAHGEHWQACIAVAKKFGNSPQRNRVKRQVRVIVTELTDLLGNFDFVIMIKEIANRLTYAQMKQELCAPSLLGRLLKERCHDQEKKEL
jgi:ribonuclease P protein component